MADRIPLVVDSSNYRIEEVPSGDSIDLNAVTLKNTSVSGVVTVTASSSVEYPFKLTGVGAGATSDIYFTKYGQVGIGTSIGVFQGIKPGSSSVDGSQTRISPKLTIYSHQTEGAGSAATQFSYTSHPLRIVDNIARWDVNLKFGQLVLGYDNAGFDSIAISTSGGVKIGSGVSIPSEYQLELVNTAAPPGLTGNVTGIATVAIGGSMFLTGNDHAGDSTIISSARVFAIKKAVRAGAGASGEYISIEKAAPDIGIGNTFLQGQGETMIRCIVDHSVDLFYNNVKKFSTSGAGCTTFGDHVITGALSKGSGSFCIPHPIAEDRELVHSFVEGPQADLIYRGTTTLSGGTATVNLDEKYGLITGTWEALCRDPQVWVTSDDGWTLCKGSVSGATLTITAQDSACAETVTWLVIAERQDDNIKSAEWTDEDGRPILEPIKKL